MNLIEKDDSRYFTATSEGSYDRHTYRIHLVNGDHVDLDDYEEEEVDKEEMVVVRVSIVVIFIERRRRDDNGNNKRHWG